MQEEIESLAPYHSMSAADLETECRTPDLVQSSMACHITTSLKAIAELNIISSASKTFPNDSLDTLVMPCEGEYVQSKCLCKNLSSLHSAYTRCLTYEIEMPRE